MAKEPNRYRTLAGSATAAERLGDAGKAKEYYSRLLALTDGSATERPELAAARQFLGRR
jgi:hypothetical protein